MPHSANTTLWLWVGTDQMRTQLHLSLKLEMFSSAEWACCCRPQCGSEGQTREWACTLNQVNPLHCLHLLEMPPWPLDGGGAAYLCTSCFKRNHFMFLSKAYPRAQLVGITLHVFGNFAVEGRAMKCGPGPCSPSSAVGCPNVT